MGQKEKRGFRDFLEEKGVDLSPEFRPKRRISIRDSVRRLREMNLGLAVFASALLAAGAAVWKLEGRAERRDGPGGAAGGRKEPAVELVFDCSVPTKPVRAERRRTPVARRARERPPEPEPVYHTVRPGDTLIGIANKYYGRGWKWTEIARANPQAAADSWKLKVGAKLLIPALDE